MRSDGTGWTSSAILAGDLPAGVDANAGDDVAGAGTAGYLARFTGAQTLAGPLAVYESGTGNVGIGTTAPSAHLHIQGGASNGAAMIATNAAAGSQSQLESFTDQDGTPRKGTIGFVYDQDVFKMVYGGNFDASANGIAINSSGYVGIGTEVPGARLDVNGQIRITGGAPGTGKVLTSDASGLASWQPPSGSGIPAGVIVMWWGSLASIPSGWALCDGTNGTLDLRGRFVMGAPAATNPGATGGTSTHNHEFDIWASDYDAITTLIHQAEGWEAGFRDANGEWCWTYGGNPTPVAQWMRGVRRATSTSTHVPPYYQVAYLMKL